MDDIFEEGYNFSMKWICSREKLATIKNGIYVKSGIFKAGLPGVAFAIWIYPHGHDKASKDKVHIYLELHRGMMKSIECNFTFKIKSAAFTKSLSNTFTPTSLATWGGLITSSEDFFDSNGKYFVNDKVIIELEGIMRGSEFQVPDRRLPFFQLMADRDDMEITVVVGKQILKIHKDILSKISPVFEKMLQENEKIEIKEFSFEIVQTFVDFCYSKNITQQITDVTAIQLLAFSDKFQINALKNTVTAALVQKLSDETVVNFATTSITYNSEILFECCICFLMLKHSDEILNIQNWDKLDAVICREIIHRALNFVSKKCV